MIHQFSKNDTALVIIDMQERLLPLMEQSIVQQMIQNINMLSQMFHHWKAPILITEQYVRGLGRTTSVVKERLPNVQPIEKTTFSACNNEAFDHQIGMLSVKSIVLVGIESHICVLQTALQLLEKGYEVVVPIDAVQSSSKIRWKSALTIMEKAGATLSNTESILFQMVKEAGTEDFKKLLGLIKTTTQ